MLLDMVTDGQRVECIWYKGRSKSLQGQKRTLYGTRVQEETIIGKRSQDMGGKQRIEPQGK
jgi:hypothetical protein